MNDRPATVALSGSASANGLAGALIVILSAWLGAVIFFSAVIAPAAFVVLPSRALAGALVGQALPVLFLAGMAAGILSLIAVFRRPGLVASRVLAIVAGAIMAVSTFVGQVVIGGRIAALRAELGGALDGLPAGHPLRAEFGRLHGFSVMALGLAVLAGAGLVGLVLLRARRKAEHG